MSDLDHAPSLTRPRSATHFVVSLLAMSVGLGLLWMMAPARHIALLQVSYAPLLPCMGIVAIIALAEWQWPQLRGGPSVTVSHRPRDLRRVGIRLVGLAATLALVAFVYWLLPEYHGDFYQPFWVFLMTLAPLGVVVPVYFWWMDARLTESHDEYLVFGRLVCGRGRAADADSVRRHLLGWTVKAFFLPLMTVYLSNECRSLYGAFDGASAHLMPVYQVFYHLSYTVDLLYCVIGYTVAIRLFDAQIRSVEPTVAGWVVALVCYQPFYSVIGRFYLQYDDGIFWDNWLQAMPTLRVIWAVGIITLTVIYALCTMAFGLRFSNLTHRGIITSGPYRFTKHPAYLAKNVSWWMISVPFISDQGLVAAARNCCLLVALNLIYYVRARTEERHLSRDPDYVAYALWMNEHGLLRRMASVLPFLRYRAPARP